MSETPRRAQVAIAVRQELARSGISAEVLSGRMGLPGDALRDRLDGLVAFDVDELETIAATFGVSIVRLLGSE